MNMCWKYLVPFSFVGIVGTIIWMVFADAVPAAAYIRYPLFLIGCLVPILILAKMVRNLKLAKSEIHLNPFV